VSDSFDDPFAGLGDAEPVKKPAKPRPRKKKDPFQQPLDVSRRDVFKATGTGGSVMHGKLYQLTTRLPLELVEELRSWAADLSMTQQDLQRYCFYRGLPALEDGERPEFEEVVVKKKLKRPGGE
jgi:hypothetical protein